MVRSAVLRLFQLLLTAWVLITLLFLFTRILPEQQVAATRFADMPSSGAVTSGQQIEQAQQATRLRLGLAAPVFYISRSSSASSHLLTSRWHWNGTANQYHQWLRTVLRGHLGRSYRTGESVGSLVGAALLVTVPLTCLAAVLTTGFSVLLGLWLAARRIPGWLLTGLYAFDSLPLFVVALFLLLLFANPDFLAFFPAYGLGIEQDSDNSIATILTQPSFFVLPLTALVLTGLTEPTMQLHNALRQETQLDYILTARAKGLSKKQVLLRHALRNALLPTLTLFTELLPNLLAGAVVVELIFALPGLGRLVADAAAARDYPVLLGGVLVVLVVHQLSVFLADWLYKLADPRLRSAN